MFIDMSLLYLLVEVWRLPWDLRILKACAAEVALLGNFAGNHLWTFGRATSLRRAARPVLRHLWRFHAICGAGIVLAAVLLHFFHLRLGLNLYLANAVAIVLVTLWNFGLNARLNWRGTDR